MNENETNAAPIVPPTSASGCSKSESDTPRTDTFFDDHLDFGYYESNEWHKFASQLERERNILFVAITEAVARFDKLSWGWDGDCGTGDIMRELEEARDKVCTLNPTADPRTTGIGEQV